MIDSSTIRRRRALEVEEALALLGVAQRRHHDLVEDPGRPFDDFEVAVVEGVEGARVQGEGHDPITLGEGAWRTTVTSVPP